MLDEIAAGDEIVIALDGKPFAKLTTLSAPKEPARRKLGVLRDRIGVHEDFDAPLPAEFMDAFDGR